MKEVMWDRRGLEASIEEGDVEQWGLGGLAGGGLGGLAGGQRHKTVDSRGESRQAVTHILWGH